MRCRNEDKADTALSVVDCCCAGVCVAFIVALVVGVAVVVWLSGEERWRKDDKAATALSVAEAGSVGVSAGVVVVAAAVASFSPRGDKFPGVPGAVGVFVPGVLTGSTLCGTSSLI